MDSGAAGAPGTADTAGAGWPQRPASVAVALLGVPRGWRHGREVPLGPPRQLAVLASLAARAGRMVPLDDLVDGVWGERPPASAVRNLHTYVAGLRAALEPDRGPRTPSRLLVRAGSGYRLQLTADQVDVAVFERLIAEARDRWADGDLAAAAAGFDGALALVAGPPLQGVPGPFAELERDRLAELRLTVLEQRADVLLGLGRHAALAGELAALARQHPLRERLWALAMLALYRCGRRAEALAGYTEARRVLLAELGVEPGAELRQLQERVLAADPALEPATARPPAAAVPAGPLPHDMRDFTGRWAELARLHELLPIEGDPAAGAVVISAVEGTAGVGKTALALHFAHQVAGRFPDGQLFVDLRGFDPRQPPVPPGHALDQLLRMVGVPPDRIPSGLDERAGLFRSLVAGRRLLVLLDNARTAEQVRPLLPGTGACLVIVTSRNQLGGLVARDGARRLALDLLDPDEAVTLLARIVGPDRVSAEPAAAARLAELCGHLPLALRVAAERVLARPRSTLAELVAALAGERGRLDQLATGDGDETTAVRAVLSWSYRALPAEAARLFRLLGLHAGPELTPAAAAALADTTVAAAGRLLAALAGAHLVTAVGADRYRLHDLLRLYAAEQAEAEETAPERAAAVRRVLGWYLRTAAAAAALLFPRPLPFEPAAAGGSCPAPDFADHAGALAWCERERANLVAAVRQAADGADLAAGWQLPIALYSLFDLRKYWADWIDTARCGLAAAERLGDLRAVALLLNQQALPLLDLGGWAEARDLLERARATFGQLGDRAGEGNALNNLAGVYLELGRFADAADHCEQALAIWRGAADRGMEAVTLVALGDAHRGQRRHAAAIGCLERAIAIFGAEGNRWGGSTGLVALAETHADLQRYPEAVEHYRRALAGYRAVGDRAGEAKALAGTGSALRAIGRTGDAVAAWRQALAIYTDLGAPEADDLRARLELFDSPTGRQGAG